MEQTSVNAGVARRLVAAAVTGIVLGSLVAPGLALASGTAPTVPLVSVSTAEDTPISGNLLTNASDPESDPLAIQSHGNFNSGFGVVSITNATGAFTFTPAANASGTKSISFTVTDGSSTVFSSLTVTVTAQNDPPECTTPAASVGNEDEVQSGTLHCTDVDNAHITYELVSPATDGSAIVNADGTWSYSPNADFYGDDSFTFTATDGVLDAEAKTVQITVTSVDDAPRCENPAASSGTQGHVQSGTLECTDPEGAVVTYELVSPATHGTAVVNSDGTWTYTPSSADFTGADSFTFLANDGGLDSDPGTVQITVDADATAPTVSMPTLALAPSRVDETASVTIGWSATDAGTGVTGYEVQQKVGTGAWVTIYVGTGTSITKAYRFSTDLVWRVRATDGASNISDWVTTTAHKVLAYQDNSSSVTYGGAWTSVASASSSGTGYRYTLVAGRWAQLKFTGLDVLYIAPKMSSGGYVRVYLDGHYLGRFSTYRSSTALGQAIARGFWSTSGSHTIKIVDWQSGKRIALDAFIVLR